MISAKDKSFRATPTGTLALLAVLVFLERFAFYGVRGFLPIYLVKALLVTQETAREAYLVLLFAIYAVSLAGGLLSDLAWSPRHTIIMGIGAEMLGCLLLSIADKMLLMPALSFWVIGVAFQRTNYFSLLGAYYLDSGRSRFLDAGFSLLYGVVNLGAFLGTMAFGLLVADSTPEGFSLALLLAAGLNGVSLALVFIFGQNLELPAKTNESTVLKIPYGPAEIGQFILVLITTAFFWLGYEKIAAVLYQSNGTTAQNMYTLISALLGVFLTGIAGTVLWTFIRVDSRFKLVGGLVVLAFALFFAPLLAGRAGGFFPVTIIVGLGELLFVAGSCSILLFYSPPGWRNTFFASASLLTFLVSRWSEGFPAEGHTAGSLSSLAMPLLLVLLALLFLVFVFVSGRKGDYSS